MKVDLTRNNQTTTTWKAPKKSITFLNYKDECDNKIIKVTTE